MEIEQAMLAFDLVSFVLVIASAVVLTLNLRDFWGATAGGAFVYFGAAVLIIGLLRAFIYLIESGVFMGSEQTVVIGWHLLFYLAMVLLLAGARTMLELVGSGSAGPSFRKRLYLASAALIVAVAIFVGAIVADPWITEVFGGSFLERSGAVHFLAFALAAAVTVLIFRLRRHLGPHLAAIANPLVVAIFFLGLVHFWELLTESWHVIILEGEVIEFVEAVVTVPALALIFYAFARSRRLIMSPTKPQF